MLALRKKRVKESQSRSVTPSLDTPSGAGLGHHIISSTQHNFMNVFAARTCPFFCYVNPIQVWLKVAICKGKY